MSAPESLWWIYFVRTPDQRLYCGITPDVERRFLQHQNGTGAKALRGKSPLLLAWSDLVGSRSQASKLEYVLKKQPKMFKERIIRENLSVLQIIEHLNVLI